MNFDLHDQYKYAIETQDQNLYLSHPNNLFQNYPSSRYLDCTKIFWCLTKKTTRYTVLTITKCYHKPLSLRDIAGCD